MQEYMYDGNALKCEDISLAEIARQYGTPLYVYSKNSIIDHCRNILDAFGGENHLAYYALKANSNRHILRLIANEGFGADVGSKGELYLALESGFPANKITYSGVGKRDDEIVYALEKNIHAFNVESTEEIEILNDIAGSMGKKAHVLLRVNLDIDAGGHSYISTSLKQNKFGISSGKAFEVLQWAQGRANIEVSGIHSHIGSQIVKAETFVAAAEALLRLVKELRAVGMQITDLDFGGGYGVQYKGYVKHPDLPHEEPEAENLSAATLIRAIRPLLENAGCRLSIQPGRSIIAHPGILLVKVLYRKVTDHKTFIVVDGGMNDLLRPSLYGSHHQIVPVMFGSNVHESVDVVGPLCESGDFLAQNRLLPSVSRGEYLAVMCAGAYGYVLASNYNARPRAAEVLIDGSGSRIIREREAIEAL